MHFALVEWTTFGPYEGCSWELNYGILLLDRELDPLDVRDMGDVATRFVKVHVTSLFARDLDDEQLLCFVLSCINRETEGQIGHQCDVCFKLYPPDDVQHVVPSSIFQLLFNVYVDLGWDLSLPCSICGEYWIATSEPWESLKFGYIEMLGPSISCDDPICPGCWETRSRQVDVK